MGVGGHVFCEVQTPLRKPGQPWQMSGELGWLHGELLKEKALPSAEGERERERMRWILLLMGLLSG